MDSRKDLLLNYSDRLNYCGMWSRRRFFLVGWFNKALERRRGWLRVNRFRRDGGYFRIVREMIRFF